MKSIKNLISLGYLLMALLVIGIMYMASTYQITLD